MLEGLFRESHSSSAALGSVQVSPSNHAVRDWLMPSVRVDVKNIVSPENRESIVAWVNKL